MQPSAAPAPRPPLRVMIVEDSATMQTLLRVAIGADPRLEVEACVESGERALALLDRARPDVISLDVRLPGMNGLELTRHVMARRPTPIVVVAASIQSEDLQISIAALRAGALAVLEKPSGGAPDAYETFGGRLCDQLVLMSAVKVITQRPSGGAEVGRPLAEPGLPPPAARPRVVGIAASTGGPKVLAQILAPLPADFPLPILLVQHITPSFHAGFVDWLRTVTRLAVASAAHGMLAAPGVVTVAPADGHLVACLGRLQIENGAPVCGQRPSATVLLESLARDYGPNAVGIVLTGMGDDGADGLLAMRRRGAHTIAEDRSTATVFGMPAAAIERQAAAEVLPARQIASRLLALAGVTGGNP